MTADNTAMDAPTATDGAGGTLTPDDVRDRFAAFVEWQAERGSDRTPLQELLTPRARLLVLDTLLGATGPLSAAQVCNRAGLDRSTFYDHEGALLAAGVVVRPKKTGNAWLYEANWPHPAVQLLRMLSVVFRHGETPMLLDEQFVGTPGEGYEPGDHPADSR